LAAACSAPCACAGRAAWLSQRLLLTRRPAVRAQRARLRAAPAPAPAAAAAAAAAVTADLQSGWSANYGDGDGVVNLVSMQTCDRRGPQH
jgi:SH3-like domain-containing protein